MEMARVRGFGLRFVLVLFAAIIASQLIANVGRATVDREPQSGFEAMADAGDDDSGPVNNWTGDSRIEPPRLCC
jgi:hypothetical protein